MEVHPKFAADASPRIGRSVQHAKDHPIVGLLILRHAVAMAQRSPLSSSATRGTDAPASAWSPRGCLRHAWRDSHPNRLRHELDIPRAVNRYVRIVESGELLADTPPNSTTASRRDSSADKSQGYPITERERPKNKIAVAPADDSQLSLL
jgi:hypothetical protein